MLGIETVQRTLILLLKQTFYVSFIVSLGGCALGEVKKAEEEPIPLFKANRLNVISPEEDQSLKDAADRAQALHMQLRELESRNVTVSRKLQIPTSTLTESQYVLPLKKNQVNPTTTRKSGSERPVTVSEKMSTTTQFSVEFSAGSSLLDENAQGALRKNIGSTGLSTQTVAFNLKTRVVIELATHQPSGIDLLNQERFRTISAVLGEAGIPASSVTFKAVRVPLKNAASSGSASRVVRIIRIEPQPVTS